MSPLIDVSVRLASPGGLAMGADDYRDIDGNMDRELAAYLFSGVTAVKSNGDPPDAAMRHRATLESGEMLGSELFVNPATSGGAIQHGSSKEAIASDLFARLKDSGAFYQPALAVVQASSDVASGKPELIDGSLVQQVAPKGLLERTRQALSSAPKGAANPGIAEIAKQNLLGAYKAGAPLVSGSDSGSPLLFHGPAVHRELQLWVQAGVPAAAALQAATYNAAKSLGASDRIGAIRKGYDATLLLVDGNPLQDISATERISSVFLKGERVNRGNLFDQK